MESNLTVVKIRATKTADSLRVYFEGYVEYINWGDGTIDNINFNHKETKSILHDYENNREYVVTICGGTKVRFYDANIIEVIQLSNTLIDCSLMFYRCSKLKSIEGLVIPNNVKHVIAMFQDCVKLSNIDNIKLSSKIKSCEKMFYRTSIRGITGLVIPNSVTSCYNMFCNSKIEYITNLVIGKNVEDCKNMFKHNIIEYVNKLVIPPNVKDCTSMFDDNKLTSLKGIKLSNGVVYCEYMFNENRNLKDISDFIIPNSVVSINCLFTRCFNLNTVSLSMNISNMDIYTQVFRQCTALKTVKIINTNRTVTAKNVFKIYNMFCNSEDYFNLDSIVIHSGSINPTSQIDYSGLSNYMSNLKSISLI